jgi:general secretion pathway protein K
MSRERGFALLAVMLVLALLGVVMGEFAFSMRLEASMVRAFKEGILATHLAEAGIHQAIREILSRGQVQAVDETGQLRFYRTVPGQTILTAVPPLPRTRVPLGPGEFSYRITDEDSRVNLNTARPDRVDRLLEALGLEKQQRDVINDSLQDWKDANDVFRPNGAESEDTYLKLPVPYRARNGPLQDGAELLQIKGVTREIYFGTRGGVGLVDLVTVRGRNIVNLNTASAPVLQAVGLSEAEITDVLQTRVRTPYASVPGRFGGRGLGVGSTTFRIEAEGLVAGEPRAQLTTIVRVRAGAGTRAATTVPATQSPAARPEEPASATRRATRPPATRSPGVRPDTRRGELASPPVGEQEEPTATPTIASAGVVILSWRSQLEVGLPGRAR